MRTTIAQWFDGLHQVADGIVDVLACLTGKCDRAPPVLLIVSVACDLTLFVSHAQQVADAVVIAQLGVAVSEGGDCQQVAFVIGVLRPMILGIDGGSEIADSVVLVADQADTGSALLGRPVEIIVNIFGNDAPLVLDGADVADLVVGGDNRLGRRIGHRVDAT